MQVLIAKGVPIGTALSFMMAVVGLSLPEALLLKKVMQIRLLVTFFGVVGFCIIGNGDSKRLTAPSIEKSTYLDAYPTQVITDSTQEVKNELIFKKKFFTNLAPIQVGETTVQTPDFIYFDQQHR